MKINLTVICVLLLYSCNTKEIVKYSFHTESAEYEIIYPKELDSRRNNFIKLNNYKSVYDSVIGENRFPVLYLFVEDSIVDNSEIISLIESDKIKYAEYSVYDEKFQIPKKILQNKKGNYKMTIAVMDFIIGDTIKADPLTIGATDSIPVDFIDSRSYHDIIIK